MKIDIIKIGNSQGIRIPKTIMEQCGFTDSIEMEIKDDSLVLSPLKSDRFANDMLRSHFTNRL